MRAHIFVCVCWNCRKKRYFNEQNKRMNKYLFTSICVALTKKLKIYVKGTKVKEKGIRSKCFALFNFYKFSQLLKWFIFNMYFVINMVHHFQYTLSHSEMHLECIHIQCVAHSNSSSKYDELGLTEKLGKTMHVQSTLVHKASAWSTCHREH